MICIHYCSNQILWSNGTHDSEDTAPRMPFFMGQKAKALQITGQSLNTGGQATILQHQAAHTQDARQEQRVCIKCLLYWA